MSAFLRNHPWTTSGLLLITLASGACSPERFFGGDEAPIRVKGGSIHLELLTGAQTWMKVGSDDKRWKMSGGRRNHADYALTVNAKAGCSAIAGRKTVVRVTYSDNHWIEFSGQGNHTAVTADVGLSTSTDQRTLSYVVSSGHISAISLDGSLVCAFGSAGDFQSLDASD
jgi:hypothetical protein